AQRLADRDGADPEFPGQPVDVEPGPRSERAGVNPVPQHRVRPLLLVHDSRLAVRVRTRRSPARDRYRSPTNSADWAAACAKSASAGSNEPTNWPNSSKLIIPNSCVQAIAARTSASGGTGAGPGAGASPGGRASAGGPASAADSAAACAASSPATGSASGPSLSSPAASASRTSPVKASGTRTAGPIVAS